MALTGGECFGSWVEANIIQTEMMCIMVRWICRVVVFLIGEMSKVLSAKQVRQSD